MRLTSSSAEIAPTTAESATVGEPFALRYERGGRVFATDGPVGTLRNVVVDGAGAEVTALVVRMDGTNDAVLVPPGLVVRGTGSALFLSVDRRTFAGCARQAVRFAPAAYARVDPRALLRNAAGVLGRWTVAAVDRNAVDLRPAAAATVARQSEAKQNTPVGMAPVRARLGLTGHSMPPVVSGVAD